MKPVRWIDAFTEIRFGGNPCAVVFGADDIPVDQRIAFTRETGLVECAFLVSSAKADFGARYYMPTGEIPLAGHPTIATVTALLHAGLVSAPARFTLEVGAGVMEIEVTEREGRPPLICMTQPAPKFGRVWEPADIAALYGLEADDVAGAPQMVSTGSPFCITELTTQSALERAALNAGAFEAFKTRHEPDFMEPFLCFRRSEEETFARLLLPPPFPPQDPFTGSATGCMAAWLFSKGRIARRFTARQGDDIGRPGRAEVELCGGAGAISGVRVAGSGVLIMCGEADI